MVLKIFLWIISLVYVIGTSDLRSATYLVHDFLFIKTEDHFLFINRAHTRFCSKYFKKNYIKYNTNKLILLQFSLFWYNFTIEPLFVHLLVYFQHFLRHIMLCLFYTDIFASFFCSCI